LREKKVRGFFSAIGVPKKITNFQKILKKHFTEQLHKKGISAGDLYRREKDKDFSLICFLSQSFKDRVHLRGTHCQVAVPL